MVNSLFLYPIQGSFDVKAIETFLGKQPDVIMDPLGSSTYLVCGIAGMKDLIREQRISNPSEFPYVVLITVKAEQITIYQQWGDEDSLRSARSILLWIRELQECRLQDEYHNDWTERVAREGVGILYPAQLT